MYPEVQAYVDTCKEANEARDAAYEKNSAARYAGEITLSEHGELNTVARRTARAACVAAWDALKTHSDPLVKFIAERYQSRYSYAVIVLEGLPADYAGLQKIAKNAGWCDDFDEYLEEMVEAGVVENAPVSPSPARKALFAWYDEENGLSRRERGELTELIDAIVADETAKLLTSTMTDAV